MSNLFGLRAVETNLDTERIIVRPAQQRGRGTTQADAQAELIVETSETTFSVVKHRHGQPAFDLPLQDLPAFLAEYRQKH